MHVIHSVVPPFNDLLGEQEIKSGEKYRLLTFVVQTAVDNGLLLYNTMTKAMILLSEKEAEQMKSDLYKLPQLIRMWFAVPVGHDDRLLSRQMRNVAQMIYKPGKGINKYTIFTTTDCNARCFYCYELGRPRIPMTEQTARRVADYIVRHCNGQTVGIQWFGGEPLYNKPVITLICRLLREDGVRYYSSMITNAYLMDEETVEEAYTDWNLKNVQITLDGTEQVYNRSKAFIHKGENPYHRVLSHIELLLNKGVHVSIRLNIDMHNADNLLLLADELKERLGQRKGLSVYSHPLFGVNMKNAAVNDDNKRKIVYEKQNQLMARLREYGLACPVSLQRHVKSRQCMADNDKCLTILPTGRIGKCEHYSEDHFVGHIDKEHLDSKAIGEFKKLHNEIDACARCVSYPDCFRLKLCETIENCYPEDRAEKLENIRAGMIEHYLKYKNNEIQN